MMPLIDHESKNMIARTFLNHSRKVLEAEIMDYQSREKYWQQVAGKLASIANWALLELLESKPGESTRDEAEEKLQDVVPFLEFNEEEE